MTLLIMSLPLAPFFFFNVCLHSHSFPLRADRWKSDNPVHGSHRGILGGIQIPSPSSSTRPATRASLWAWLQANHDLLMTSFFLSEYWSSKTLQTIPDSSPPFQTTVSCYLEVFSQSNLWSSQFHITIDQTWYFSLHHFWHPSIWSFTPVLHVHVSLLNSAILNYFCTLYCIFFHSFLFSADLSTIQGLFVQLTHLLCNKLVVIRSSRWKSDVHITLSAFELLSSLAQLSMDHLGKEHLMYVVLEFYPCFSFIPPWVSFWVW